MIIRTGIIGLGMMGRNHARVARETEGIELVAVADAAGDPHNVAGTLPLYETVDQLIDHGLDAAICAVPTRFHYEVASRLAEAKIHTMVEKPIASTLEEAQQLVDAFNISGLVGVVGHIERFNPALQEMRRRIANGQLGEIYQVTTRREGPYPSRVSDVGVVKDLATHDIDLTQTLTDSTYESISAQTVRKAGREHEDMLVAVGRTSSGVITSHVVNWLSAKKVRETTVIGEKGVLVADTLTADLTFYENGSVETTWQPIQNFRGVSEGEVTRYAFPKTEPLKNEHIAFRDAILDKSNEAVSMEQGLEVLRVAEQMLASSASSTDHVSTPQ
jgi:predicted dehydrogenase